MGIEVEETKIVRSDPEVIWELLSKPEGWKGWWPACVEARLAEDPVLRDGSQLEVVLKPATVKMTFHPVVDLFTENKHLSLTHRSAFIQTTAVWYLTPRPDATLVKAEIIFNGLFPFLVTIAQRSSVVRYALQSNLRGLKRHAERFGG